MKYMKLYYKNYIDGGGGGVEGKHKVDDDTVAGADDDNGDDDDDADDEANDNDDDIAYLLPVVSFVLVGHLYTLVKFIQSLFVCSSLAGWLTVWLFPFLQLQQLKHKQDTSPTTSLIEFIPTHNICQTTVDTRSA